MDDNDNRLVIRIITTTLAVLTTVSVTSICILAYFGSKIPPELNTLTGALVGSLGSMLTKTSPTTSSPSGGAPSSVQPVHVVNPPSDPVPTTEEAKT